MAAQVAGLEVVVVHAVAVPVVIDAVPGAMQEALGVSCLRDHVPGRRVDLRAGGQLAELGALAQELEGGIPGLEHVSRDSLDVFRHALPEEVDARQIGVDARRC